MAAAYEKKPALEAGNGNGRKPEIGPENRSLLQFFVPGSFTVLHTTDGAQPLHKAVLANLQSAILVAMVSLSLSIGLGIASGSGPVEGMRTAMWGGIMSGWVVLERYRLAPADAGGAARSAWPPRPLTPKTIRYAFAGCSGLPRGTSSGQQVR